jgi:hypothetical protein
MILPILFAAVGLSSSGLASAAGIAEICVPFQPDICFGLAVPETTAAADDGSGDIFFRISAPTSYAWVALGTGTSMSDSNILVMYQDGSGNVTVSPRIGRGHTEPKHTDDASSVTVLAGSGVSADGETMVAEIRCADCQSWVSADGEQQQLDLDGMNSFIAAWAEGKSIASADKAASISYHNDHVEFQSDLSSAVVTTTDADTNPFLDGNSSSKSGTNNTQDAIFGGGGFGDGTGMPHEPRLVTHGVIMGITFVLLYPAGAIMQPLLKLWYLHASWQMAAFVLMWVGFGFGYIVAQDYQMLFTGTHTIMGTVVCAVMALQPIFGYLHHRHFVAHRRRSVVSHVHINLGRILLLLGIVNGGIGLKIARAPTAATSAYAIIAAGMALTYAGIATLSELRRRKLAREEQAQGQTWTANGVPPSHGEDGGFPGSLEDRRGGTLLRSLTRIKARTSTGGSV